MDNINRYNNVKMVDTSLVNKILEQGQKLRNAMVGSILKNDPFNTNIIYSKHFNTPETSTRDLNDINNFNPVTSTDAKRVEAYIKGEYMTKDDEKLALDTLRSMSAPDLCKTTERTLNSACLSSCKCYTCEIYNSNNIYCDLRRKNKKLLDSANKLHTFNEITKDIQEKYKSENESLLRYVDSLKISINNLTLNEIGDQKVSDNDKKVPYNLIQTYFLEYRIPDCIVNKCIVSKSKVNSGLENDYVRFCSRRSSESINFKQITIHDIKNLDKINLDEYEIKIKISYRMQKQKNASTLGFAKFNFGSFLLSKNLVCNRILPVFLSDSSPIVVGHLKVSLLLGCGRLYFGQEFIDAISSFERDSGILDSDDSTNQFDRAKSNENVSNDINIKEQTYPNRQVKENERKITESVPKNSILTKTYKKTEIGDSFAKPMQSTSKSVGQTNKNEGSKQNRIIENVKQQYSIIQSKTRKFEQAVNDPIGHTIQSQISKNESQILFGFLYISEVQYLSPPISTYITCRPFCQNETSCSKLVTDTSNPVFNFSQLVPLIYEDELLQLLRENYMVVEFWKKIDSTDLVIGLTKISLHQFYLAYRNPVFVKYLSKNKLPITDTDWWEPIYSVDSKYILGQVQILVALGTEEQINNLKSERGFTNNIVKAKFSSQPQSKYETDISEKLSIRDPHSVYKSRHENNTRDFLQLKNEHKNKYNISNRIYDSNKLEEIGGRHFSKFKEKSKYPNFIDKAVNTSPFPKIVYATSIRKLDVGTQSNLEMDKMVDTRDEDKISPTQEMLGNFLNQMMAQKQKNIFVENSTNTDPVDTDKVKTTKSNNSQMLQKAQDNTDINLRRTTDLLDSLEKALSLDGLPDYKTNAKTPGMFRVIIRINSANHLPSRKKCKSKKSRNRSIKNDDNVLPSCYVTFETSESDLNMTPVILKTTSPSWNYKCEANLQQDLLINSQRRLIFKVWRKATNTVLTPNMQTDVVLGFAAVDLTVLVAGFPNVQGWFNIIDFTGKCNGQINIHITPLEDLSRYMVREDQCSCSKPNEDLKTEAKSEEAPSELLSRTLKRKFTELDEITQRLRLRLSKVTNEDSDTSSDGAAEEFEKDINTLCIEEDFDLIDFDEEARRLNFNYNKESATTSAESPTNKLQPLLSIKEDSCSSKESEHPLSAGESKVSSSNSATSLSQDAANLLGLSCNSDKEKELLTLDKHLQEGKQKIDTLLEKLSLISADTNNTFASRYVSGCSLNNDYNAINIDTEAILKELDHSSRPNIHSSLGFEPLKFQQLYGGSVEGSSLKSRSSVSHTSNSDTSVITNFSDCRPAPDGQGNISDDKIVKK